MRISSNSSAFCTVRCIKMIELLLMDADEMKNPDIFQEAMKLVGATRQNRIMKLRKQESKRLSLAAGLLLRYAFLSRGQLNLYEKIEVTAKGKPFLPNNEYFFSMSHSGKFAICAFSDSPIGCDIEKLRDNFPRVTKKILTADEDATFQTLDESEQIAFFFRLWTCKESVTKWIGKGIAYPFVNFSAMEGLQVRNSISIEGKKLYLKSFLIEDYAVSLCTEASAFPREIKRMTWNILMKN